MSTCNTLREEHQRSPGQSGRQRRQTGHTNCWRLKLPSAGDLLGQAQIHRADLNHQTITSVDTLRITSRREQSISPQNTASCHSSGDQASPENSFYSLAQEVTQNSKPDAVLECLGSFWELHCPYLSRSHTLAKLYLTCKKKRNIVLKTRAESVCSAGHGGWMLRETRRLDTSCNIFRSPILITLPTTDPSLTTQALSFALKTLYRPEERPDVWGGAVLSAAVLLGLPQLYQRCLHEMKANITVSTVCDFHQLSYQHRQTGLQSVCERWLELFLVTELSGQTELRKLTSDLLLKTLHSCRVFAISEFDLLKTVLYWIYLQFNTSVQTLPPHSTIISFFCRSAGGFLEQPRGHKYVPLFQALRLHAITERHHVEEMLKINVFPSSWLSRVFSNHYYSEHQHFTRTVSLYGFYFLLKASRLGDSESVGLCVERLKHLDPVLLGHCLTQLVSVRSERCVCYQVRVQACNSGEYQEHHSPVIRHVFSLSKRYCKSQVFTVNGLSLPLFVTFALAFPSQ